MSSIPADPRASYRRGVVLGLSMAEAMLVFLCAVILLFSVQVHDLNRIITELREQLAETQSLQPPNAAPPPPEEAERLRRTRQAMAELEGEGVDLAALPDLAQIIGALQTMLGNGYSREQIADMLDAMQQWGSRPEDQDRLRRSLQFFKDMHDQGVALADLLLDRRLLEALAGLRRDRVTVEEILAILERPRQSPGSGPDATVPDGRWPPMIRLTEGDGYTFGSNSFELTGTFPAKMNDIVERIVELATAYGVDVIEVSGHTDDRRVNRISNLDDTLLPALDGTAPLGIMQHGDNVGLGMARAVAVARELRKDPRLAGYTIVPVSVGFLLDTDGSVVTEATREDLAARRRIEIRVRKNTLPERGT